MQKACKEKIQTSNALVVIAGHCRAYMLGGGSVGLSFANCPRDVCDTTKQRRNKLQFYSLAATNCDNVILSMFS